ncbi:hypothetical protein V5P93_006967 [Actinokineospora auranticolor]|uniref:Uncharacterized protein n=1 Tax=Actinokineospora auranticolor TaxID=155976 RepID=A0A2S6GH99_9PSEU|nr:hypothetical protein [Actinokineospora auranticolor]PPK64579.1 hypothetical protein CLV40_119146 [Actinokineospora auranticolor]
MSQEGGSERTQRTVAELLAKYGGNSGDSAPRRRRRKPDDASDTAPQAIIERVMSDSGKMLPIRDDQEPQPRTSHRQGRAPQPSQQFPVPQPSQQLPQPPPQLPVPPGQPPRPLERPPVNGRPEQAPPGRDQRGPVRNDDFRDGRHPDEQHRPDDYRPEGFRPGAPSGPGRAQPGTGHPGSAPGGPGQAGPVGLGQPGPGRGVDGPQGPPRPEVRPGPQPRREAPEQFGHPDQRPPVEHSRPPVEPQAPSRGEQPGPGSQRPVGARLDAPEPHTEQFPRVPADDHGPDPAEPPAELAKGPNRAPLLPRRSPSTARRAAQLNQPTQQAAPVPQPSQQLPQPSQQLPVPPQPSQQLPVPQPSQQLPRPGAPVPGEFAGDSAQTAVDPEGPPPEFHEEFEGFDDKAATRFTEYEAHDDFRDRGDFDEFDDDRRGGVDVDEDDREPDDRAEDEEDEDEEPRSAGREWLIMIGQLGLGVVGGAGVWLLFNWLWRVLPAAALIGALVVIVGLVLIVRKVRRAEDLQTTVLAVLVGLLATVSPAALLLLDH